jgi:hypothetical protein
MKIKLEKHSRVAIALTLGVCGMLLAGCAAPKEKPTLQRGWVGGNYRYANVPPPKQNGAVTNEIAATPPKSGLQVTFVRTNSPAAMAGLRQGDYILAVDQKSVTGFKSFLRIIDESKPGSLLPVRLWRDGHYMETTLCVGRETFRTGGYFSVMFPTVVHNWDLWFPGFIRGEDAAWGRGLSVVFAGWEIGGNHRPQLDRERPKQEIFAGDVDIWLVIFEASKGKRILSQEIVAPQTSWLNYTGSETAATF